MCVLSVCVECVWSVLVVRCFDCQLSCLVVNYPVSVREPPAPPGSLVHRCGLSMLLHVAKEADSRGNRRQLWSDGVGGAVLQAIHALVEVRPSVWRYGWLPMLRE